MENEDNSTMYKLQFLHYFVCLAHSFVIGNYNNQNWVLHSQQKPMGVQDLSVSLPLNCSHDLHPELFKTQELL